MDVEIIIIIIQVANRYNVFGPSCFSTRKSMIECLDKLNIKIDDSNLLDAHIMWLSDYNGDAHDVYFGTNKSTILSANTSSSEYKGRMKTPSNIVDPGPLQSMVSYYWRIDTIVKSTIITGPVWTFKCK